MPCLPDAHQLAIRLWGSMALAFVCRTHRGKWPGMVGHTIENNPILVRVTVGAVG